MAVQGRQLAGNPHRFSSSIAKAESAGGKQFAMMAAQGLDLLWIVCFVLATFCHCFATSRSSRGMFSTIIE